MADRVYTYRMGEAAAEVDMPASTIRFHDRRGPFPDMVRGQGGIRHLSGATWSGRASWSA